MEEKIIKFIKDSKLLSIDDVVGVACSGGRDSIALLYFLHTHRERLGIDVVAINVDHCIRPHSSDDSDFVKEFCRDRGIRVYSFKVDAIKVSVEKKLSIETAAREARYGTFEALINKGLVDKIALGHHISDQVETILVNIFRGASVGGAKGMEPIRDGIYIRPFLTTSREEIDSYVIANGLSFMEDETNADTQYTRNFIRHDLIPTIRKRFKGVERNIINFATACHEDDHYIDDKVDVRSILSMDNMVKIPLTYFSYDDAIINRIIVKAVRMLAANKMNNLERRHINIIKSFVSESENGAVISLPNGIKVHKEYDYITITTMAASKLVDTYRFKKGKLVIPGYGEIKTHITRLREPTGKGHIVDVDAIPVEAEWRYRKEGDLFTPYKGNVKKLKEYFIDKKIPQRLRDNIPVLAYKKDIYIIADIEISDLVKVSPETIEAYKVTYKKDLL